MSTAPNGDAPAFAAMGTLLRTENPSLAIVAELSPVWTAGRLPAAGEQLLQFLAAFWLLCMRAHPDAHSCLPDPLAGMAG